MGGCRTRISIFSGCYPLTAEARFYTKRAATEAVMKHIGHTFIALLTAFFAAHAHAQTSDLQIAFTTPVNGAVLQSPITLNVIAAESSNTIVTAEFFANGQSLGVVGNNVVFPVTPLRRTSRVRSVSSTRKSSSAYTPTHCRITGLDIALLASATGYLHADRQSHG